MLFVYIMEEEAVERMEERLEEDWRRMEGGWKTVKPQEGGRGGGLSTQSKKRNTQIDLDCY